MKFSLNSLKIFLDFYKNVTIEDIANALNSLGHEVDDVFNASREFIVVKIIDIQKHINAEKLNICTVTDGNKNYEIICGASNVYVGMITVLAQIGSYIPKGDFFVQSAKIRGIKSDGMLCSAEELMLSNKSLYNDGILSLDNNYNIGDVFIKELSDVVFDISLTPNRGDCFSAYGIAYELSGYGLGQMKKIDNIDLKKERVTFIKNTSARLGYFLYINNISTNIVDESMSAIMRFVNLKKISYGVDVTNFVSYLFGQPLHIYNRDRIKNKLTITKGLEVDFKALDGEIYNIQKDDVVIIDDNQNIQSLGGIMGGELAMYNNEKNVILEAVLFYNSDIRSTGGRLKIISEARKKYERFVSSELIEFAVSYALKMLQGNLEIIYYDEVEVDSVVKIDLNMKYINKLAGFDMDINNLSKFGFVIQNNEVIVPNRRSHEITTNQDLASEILRINSYDNIPDADIRIKLSNYTNNDFHILNKVLHQKYVEVVNFAFVEEDKNKSLELVNAISNKKYMRSSMLYSMINNLDKNKYAFILHEGIKQFEYGVVFNNDIEHEVLTLMMYGKNKRFLKDTLDYTFYDLKEDVVSILSNYKVRFTNKIDDEFISHKSQDYHYNNYIMINNIPIGILGRVSLDMSYDNIFFAEIFIDKLKLLKEASHEEINENNFPVIIRDFCFLTEDRDIGHLISKILTIQDVKNVVLYDIYTNSKTIRVYIQNKDKVLNGEEIENIYTHIVNIFSKENMEIKLN